MYDYGFSNVIKFDNASKQTSEFSIALLYNQVCLFTHGIAIYEPLKIMDGSNNLGEQL